MASGAMDEEMGGGGARKKNENEGRIIQEREEKEFQRAKARRKTEKEYFEKTGQVWIEEIEDYDFRTWEDYERQCRKDMKEPMEKEAWEVVRRTEIGYFREHNERIDIGSDKNIEDTKSTANTGRDNKGSDKKEEEKEEREEERKETRLDWADEMMIDTWNSQDSTVR